MRTAGMIGGLGPESTVDYYRSIIARFRALKPNGGYPHVIKESQGMEGEVGQGLQSGVSDCRMQTEARFSRLPQGRCGTYRP